MTVSVNPSSATNSGSTEPEAAEARELAARLGVRYLDNLDSAQLLIREDDCIALLGRDRPQVWAILEGALHPPSAVVVPNSRAAGVLGTADAAGHALKSRIRVATTRTVRAALHQRCAAALTRLATRGLSDSMPEFSASVRMNAAQGAAFGVLAVIFMDLLIFRFGAAMLSLHIAATIFFLGCTALRAMAIFGVPPVSHRLPKARREEPVYTVLVALWREANMVPQLMAALSQLVWPADRLEIKLICEADDPETIAAIEASPLRAIAEIVAVPPSQPRTKPKALRYALPMCRGEFVVLYDAEDIPHPEQLQEAWRTFDAAPPHLACLQSPLEIVNAGTNWIARCFAFEYAALYRGLVPWLAANGLAFPLGGTSNHFRRSVLDTTGAWDPHNVTEDADLGMRLARLGYATGVLSRPTFEAGPESLSDWLPQRARWNKGWLQTWLVHMRSPARLARELGFRSFAATQFVLFGMVFSALVHPLMIATAFYLAFMIAAGAPFDAVEVALAGMDAVSILGSYAGFLALGWTRLRPAELPGFWRVVTATPVYWLLISAAAWKAVRDLGLRPFHWDKTRHVPVMRSRRRRR